MPTDLDNPYQPPEAEIVARAPAPPRRLHHVAAATVCLFLATIMLGGAVTMLLLIARDVDQGTWRLAPFRQRFIPMLAMNLVVGLAFLGAGREFLRRRGWRGLLLVGVAFGLTCSIQWIRGWL